MSDSSIPREFISQVLEIAQAVFNLPLMDVEVEKEVVFQEDSEDWVDAYECYVTYAVPDGLEDGLPSTELLVKEVAYIVVKEDDMWNREHIAAQLQRERAERDRTLEAIQKLQAKNAAAVVRKNNLAWMYEYISKHVVPSSKETFKLMTCVHTIYGPLRAKIQRAIEMLDENAASKNDWFIDLDIEHEFDREGRVRVSWSYVIDTPTQRGGTSLTICDVPHEVIDGDMATLAEFIKANAKSEDEVEDT